MSEMLATLNDKELAAFSQLNEMTIDDLADLPSMQPFPNGAHSVTVKFEAKVVNDKPAIIMHATYVDPAQLDEGEEATAKTGDQYDFMYGLTSDYGQGALKELLKVVREKTGITEVLPALEAVQDAGALIITKKRMDKKNDVMRCNIEKFELF